MAEYQVVEVPYGDYREIDILIKDETEELVDLEGKGLRFTLKQSTGDGDSEALLTKMYGKNDDVILFDEGHVKVILWPEETRLTPGSYYFDLKVYDGTKVFTVVIGKLKITQTVWRGDDAET